MSEFKSGIILRNKCVIVQDDNESHTSLLKALKIEDSYGNATKIFVRAELVPLKNEWWSDILTWKFVVDQDILPYWFEEDRGRYEQEFREEVSDWAKKHIFVDKHIDELSEGYYSLKRCKVSRISKNAVAIIGDTDIDIIDNNSVVSYMRGNSHINRMVDNSEVSFIYDCSAIKEMHDRSNITKMNDTSLVEAMYDNSFINEVHDKSRIKEMHGNSRIWAIRDESSVDNLYDKAFIQNPY